MTTPAPRRSRARALQLTGGACVAIGVFIAVLTWAVLHSPAAVRWGVLLVVIGAVLLVVAAVLRRIHRFGRRAD